MRPSSERRSSLQVERTAHYLLALNSALAPLTDVCAIKSTVARVLGAWLGVARVIFVQVNGDTIEISSDWCDGIEPLSGAFPLDFLGKSAQYTIGTGATRFIDDVEQTTLLPPEERAHYLRLGVRASMGIGFLRDGRWVASFAVHSACAREWTPIEQAIFHDTAARVWLAMQHDAAERALAAVRQREVDASNVTMSIIQEADRRKDEFLVTMAHELRGPLAPLRNGLDLARSRQSDDPLLVSALSIADRQVNRLVRLVDDLLDIGRINSGRLELRQAQVGLHDILMRSIEAVRPVMEGHRHTLMAEARSTAHRVLGDADRLVQVFTNLLANAAKYTPDGGHIGVTLTHEAGWEVVHVQDTGIGIPHTELERVFDLFSRVRVQQDAHVDGLGIGLAITKSVVELHGGTITVFSEGLGRGSRFSVRLPVYGTEPRGVERVADAVAAAPARRLVLVVDDNIDSTEMLSLLIQSMGHDTVVANTGSAAVQLAVSARPDLILLDLGLPDMHGTEVARAICDHLGDQRPWIAALTGWGQPSDRERTKAAGFNMHFVKPLNREALEALVTALNETGGRAASTVARAGVIGH